MYDIQNPISYFPIGNQRDFGHTVQFDLTAWAGLNADDWKITYTRPGEASTYPVPDGDVSVADNVLTWTISEAVTALDGTGSVIIEAYRGGDMLKHSIRIMTIIGEGHEPAGPAPDPVEDWIADATSKLDEVDESLERANSAEDLRETAETARESAEGLRAGAETSRNTAEGLRVIAEQGRQDAYVIAEEARDGLYEAAEIARDELFESAETTRNTQSGEATDRVNTIAGTLEGIAPLWSGVDISVSALGEGAAPTASITQGETGTSITLGIPRGDTGNKGDKGNDGKPFTYRGDYNAGADPLYTKNDVVRFGGGSFVYINDVDSNEPTSSTSHWQQIAEKGDKGDTGDTGDSGVYVGTETPVNGEIVWIDTDGTPIKMYFKDKVILTTDFVADATYTEFPFKADIPCVGVTSTMYASLAYAQATSGDFAPVCDTGAGIVTIYAAEVPAADIAIPVIEVLAI